MVDCYRLTKGDELFYSCFYCEKLSLVYCKSDKKCLCGDHYEMHRNGDPWLSLVELIMETCEE